MLSFIPSENSKRGGTSIPVDNDSETSNGNGATINTNNVRLTLSHASGIANSTNNARQTQDEYIDPNDSFASSTHSQISINRSQEIHEVNLSSSLFPDRIGEYDDFGAPINVSSPTFPVLTPRAGIAQAAFRDEVKASFA